MFRTLTEKASTVFRKMSSSTQESYIRFSDACFNCDVECSNHPQLPLTMQKRIDQSTLYKTFKPYKSHLIIPSGDGETWPEHVEDLEPFKSIQSITQESKDRIMVTGYETGTPNPGWFVFPQGYVVHPQPDAFNQLGEFMVKGENLDLEHSTINGPIVFVCNHKKRDKRCGVAGPLLIEEFKKYNVQVYGISHIGGHKFAGNIIIYRQDSRGVFVGDWYGRVKTCHVETIVKECIENGNVIKELWRGQMNAHPNDPNLDW